MSQFPSTQLELLNRLKDRSDQDAWAEFVRLYRPALHRSLMAKGLQGADADELVQEVMINVMRAIGDFQIGGRIGSFRKWLLTIARNRTINSLTRQPNRDTVGGSGAWAKLQEIPNSTDQLERELQVQWRRQFFLAAAEHVRSEVQPKTWAAFWKTAIDEISPADVAGLLDMSLGAVHVARSRTLAKIRQWVESQSSQWEGAEL